MDDHRCPLQTAVNQSIAATNASLANFATAPSVIFNNVRDRSRARRASARPPRLLQYCVTVWGGGGHATHRSRTTPSHM